LHKPVEILPPTEDGPPLEADFIGSPKTAAQPTEPPG